jgi:hypothetical protein
MAVWRSMLALAVLSAFVFLFLSVASFSPAAMSVADCVIFRFVS